MTEMIALQEVWEAAGGHPEIKATKEEVLLVLNLLDQCVDEQDEDIKKLDQEVEKLKEALRYVIECNDVAMPDPVCQQWMGSPCRAECVKVLED